MVLVERVVAYVVYVLDFQALSACQEEWGHWMYTRGPEAVCFWDVQSVSVVLEGERKEGYECLICPETNPCVMLLVLEGQGVLWIPR